MHSATPSLPDSVYTYKSMYSGFIPKNPKWHYKYIQYASTLHYIFWVVCPFICWLVCNTQFGCMVSLNGFVVSWLGSSLWWGDKIIGWSKDRFIQVNLWQPIYLEGQDEDSTMLTWFTIKMSRWTDWVFKIMWSKIIWGHMLKPCVHFLWRDLMDLQQTPTLTPSEEQMYCQGIQSQILKF